MRELTDHIVASSHLVNAMEFSRQENAELIEENCRIQYADVEMWLQRRTVARIKRNVEGTNQK